MQKQGLYERIAEQLEERLKPVSDPISRMATIAAVLHHKMEHFFWTGFYRLVDREMIVGPYQGFLACPVLERGRGVCWAAANKGRTIIVADVNDFEGHIACDPRSKSEIVVPCLDRSHVPYAVLDVDSDQVGAFDEADRVGLERIVQSLL